MAFPGGSIQLYLDAPPQIMGCWSTCSRILNHLLSAPKAVSFSRSGVCFHQLFPVPPLVQQETQPISAYRIGINWSWPQSQAPSSYDERRMGLHPSASNWDLTKLLTPLGAPSKPMQQESIAILGIEAADPSHQISTQGYGRKSDETGKQDQIGTSVVPQCQKQAVQLIFPFF